MLALRSWGNYILMELCVDYAQQTSANRILNDNCENPCTSGLVARAKCQRCHWYLSNQPTRATLRPAGGLKPPRLPLQSALRPPR